MLLDNRSNHWRDIIEENNEYKGKFNALRCEVYMKYKEEFIKRDFLVEVLHTKGVNIVWTCMEDNVIRKK